MGGIFGGGSSKKAALKAAAATDKATNLSTANTNYQAQAMAAQLAQAQAQRVATEYAESLLSRPPETVDVNLAPDNGQLAPDDGDLLTRRQGIRTTYQRPSSTARVTTLSPSLI